MKIRFLGHSATEVQGAKVNLLIDPFITGNAVCPVKAEELSPQVIILTHGHGDHVGDTIAIAERTGALVVCGYDTGLALEAKGLKVHTMGLGGKWQFDWGMLRMVPAFHGSGMAACHPAGWVIHLDGKRFYHAGDTCLYSDMKLLNGVIEEPGIDVAMLPIGDRYTMGPEEAAIAAQWIGAQRVIPIHYGSFPGVLTGTAEAFQSKVAALGGPQVVVLKPGETYSI
jgi:L-ascorbate metabolism protein UlaG (beta-lactamase superfamily)